MGVVRIIITVMFLFFAACFLLISFGAAEKHNGDAKAITNFIIGSLLAIMSYALWLF